MSLPRKLRCLTTCIVLVASPAVAQSTNQNWQGAYAGVHLGGVFADFDNRLPANPGPAGDTSGFLGGVQLGYNWQIGDVIYGPEADLSVMDVSRGFAGGQFDEDVMTSLRFRAGKVVGETLVFGSLGVAWTERDTTLTGVGSDSDYQPGLMLGGGAERFLTDRLTGRVEAYYVDVPDDPQNAGGTTTSGGSQNLILRAGLNLHF